MVRVAELRLRGRDGPLRARAYWPSGGVGALLVLFPAGDPDTLGEVCTSLGVVVLAPASRLVADAVTALEWAADHAGELGADPDRLLVAGEGTGADLATAAARHAAERGWPVVARLVLIFRYPAGEGIHP